MNLPPASEEVFWKKSWHVGDSKHLQFHRLVLSLISATGRPVCPPFYQPVVVLEVVSRRAAEGIFVSPTSLLLPEALLLFFPQNNRASAACYFTFLVLIDAKPSPLRSTYGAYDPGCQRSGVIGQTIGSVVSCCGFTRTVLTQVVAAFLSLICLLFYLSGFLLWHEKVYRLLSCTSLMRNFKDVDTFRKLVSTSCSPHR